ncbi:hypothetical protein OXIME_000269 [Oxyplasma meridianum]|uniref:Uncharacterized protein n=1 Tax=Oxyplasma meridianum TaxID=3073602 RepID=A0AAX4NE66_9ARCH
MKSEIIKSGRYKGKESLFLDMREIKTGDKIDESLLSSVSERFSRIKVRESDDNFIFIYGDDPFRYQGISAFGRFLKGITDFKFKLLVVTYGNIMPQKSFAEIFSHIEIHPDYARVKHFYERGVLESYGKFDSYAVFRFNHGDRKEMVARFIHDFKLNEMEKFMVLSRKFTYTQMDIAKYLATQGIKNVSYQFES